MKKINRQNLIEIVAEEAHLSKKDASNAIVSTFDVIKDSLMNNVEVNIPGFGSFVPLTKKPRKGTDPKTHKEISISQKKSVSFRPSKIFKEDINK